MFTTEVNDSRSLAAWSTQQVAIPILSWILTYIAMLVPETILARRATNLVMDAGIEAFLTTILFWSSGFILAILIRQIFPSAAPTGKWIWVLPTLLVVYLIAWDFAKVGNPIVLIEYFYPKGEQAWIAYLAVFPTYACIAYSLGMSAASSKIVKRFIRTSPTSLQA